MRLDTYSMMGTRGGRCVVRVGDVSETTAVSFGKIFKSPRKTLEKLFATTILNEGT